MLYGLIIVIIAIIGVLMVTIVLLQSGKGGGLAGIAAMNRRGKGLSRNGGTPACYASPGTAEMITCA